MEGEAEWPSGGGLWLSVFLSVFYTGRKHINTHLTYIFACLHNSHSHNPLPPLHPQTQMHTQPGNYYEVFFVIKG